MLGDLSNRIGLEYLYYTIIAQSPDFSPEISSLSTFEHSTYQLPHIPKSGVIVKCKKNWNNKTQLMHEDLVIANL